MFKKVLIAALAMIGAQALKIDSSASLGFKGEKGAGKGSKGSNHLSIVYADHDEGA